MSSIRSIEKGPPFLFGLLFLVVGLVLTSLIFGSFIRYLRPSFWPEEECRIRACRVEPSTEVGKYDLTLEYVYSAQGREFVGQAIDCSGELTKTFDSIERRQKLFAHFAEGTTHRCRVNPSDPTDAVLQTADVLGRTELLILPFLLVPLIFILFGGGVVVVRVRGWLGLDAVPEILRRSFAINLKKILPLVFGIVFSALGYGFLSAYLIGFFGTPDFETIDGMVISADVRVHHGKNSTYYSPCIAYRYEVNGETYESDRYKWGKFRFGSKSDSRSSAKHIVKAHLVGSKIEVLYSPRYPEKCCLERPDPFGIMDLAACLFFGLFAFAGTIAFGFWLREVWPKTAGLGRSYSNEPLKRKLLGEIVSGIVFCVVWNVASFMFICFGLSMEAWLFAAIAGVFQLVGSCCIFKLVRQGFKRLRGVHYKVRLTANVLKPGEMVRLDYEQEGKRVVDRLVISVVQYDSQNVQTGKSGYQAEAPNSCMVAERKGVETRMGSVMFRIPDPIQAQGRRSWRLELAATGGKMTSVDQFGFKVICV